MFFQKRQYKIMLMIVLDLSLSMIISFFVSGIYCRLMAFSGWPRIVDLTGAWDFEINRKELYDGIYEEVFIVFTPIIMLLFFITHYCIYCINRRQKTSLIHAQPRMD